MGQKVGGYRRNTQYGKETRLLSASQSGKRGWDFEVNPKGLMGWNRGTSGRKEKEYGEELNGSRILRKEVEEVRKLFGCVTNGRGRKGTKQMGYTVYGEYTGRLKSQTGKSKVGEKTGKSREDKEQLDRALERVVINHEIKRNCKVDRKRKNLKERRREDEIERVLKDKKEREIVLGYSSKRKKGEIRCEAIAFSGVMNITQRRTNVVVGELEGSMHHMDVLRKTELLRKYHAKSSQYGRKRLGQIEKKSNSTDGLGIKGGYYGINRTVKGPLEGARRTMSYVVPRGTVPRGTKRARIIVSNEHAKTTYGTMGVRVKYCYSRG